LEVNSAVYFTSRILFTGSSAVPLAVVILDYAKSPLTDIMGYPWITVQSWEPFHIDALGVLSLLGAEAIDITVGRLVASKWLEYMPLLAGFVIASDCFRKKNPAFLFYNLTKGIHTTDLAPWFSRWVQCQEFETTRSIVYWDVGNKPQSWLGYQIISGAFSICLIGLLLAMTVLSKDWYGLANAIALMVSVIVRAYILQANRNAVDRAVKSPERNAKTLLITPDSKIITMFIPDNLIVSIFVRKPRPYQNWLYLLFQWAGWASFAVHVLAIGMANLATQLYSVLLILISSILICWKFGCDDSTLGQRHRNLISDHVSPAYSCWIGSRLRATVFEWPLDMEFRRLGPGPTQWRLKDASDRIEHGQRSERRMDLYAWLNLTSDEEDSLGKWDLLPHKRCHDNSWQQEFNAKKALVRDQYRPHIETIKRGALQAVRGRHHMRPAVPVDGYTAMEAQGPDSLTPASPQRRNSELTTSGLLVGREVT
jgi:hypothetical protein